MNYAVGLGLFLFCMGLSAHDDPYAPLNEPDYDQILTSLVKGEPRNKDILFINALFTLKNPIRHDEKHLTRLQKQLEQVGPKHFGETYQADPKYYLWLVGLFDDLQVYNQSKDEDLLVLAKNVDQASHIAGDALNNLPNNKLLFLIRYLSSISHRVILERPEAESFYERSISSSQLLVILQEEKNSRSQRPEDTGTN